MDNNKRKPTIKDVAKMAGVSFTTVSRFINSSGYVDANTADKIRAAIDRLNYIPNKIARGLKTNSSQNIMLIIPDISNPYYSEMYKVIQWLARDREYSVILFDTNEKTKNEFNAIKLCESVGADGMIFCSIDSSASVFEELRKFNKPVVVSNLYDELAFDTVHSIGGKGIYTAAKYLVENGHRKIAYIGGEKESAINKRRKNGFLAVLEEAGIPFCKDFLFEMDFTMDAGYKAGMYLHSLREKPTAVCAANDLIAMGIMLAFNELGIKIPDDISLTGEDNIDFAKVSKPGLTTVNNRGSYFAENAMRMLFERMDGSYTGPPREIVCPRELVIRDSVKKRV
jgi:DNA-binding LacI/PurR family transcriptional regulator